MASVDDPERPWRVALDGAVEGQALAAWLGAGMLEGLSGSAPISGDIDLSAKPAPMLRLSSSLEGLGSHLPFPLGKSPAQAVPARLKIQLDRSRRTEFSLSERLAGVVEPSGAAPRCDIRLGIAGEPPPAAAGDDACVVSGRLPFLDVGSWQEALGSDRGDDGVTGDPRASAAPLVLRAEGVVVGELRYGAALLREAGLDFELRRDGQGKAWASEGSLDADWLAASWFLPGEARRDWLRVDRLDLAGLPEGGEGLDYRRLRSRLRPLDVTLLDLRDGDEPLGHLAFRIDPTDEALWFADIRGELAGLAFAPGREALLRWGDDAAGGVATRLEADLVFADAGETLEQLGFARVLESRRGSATLHLAWPGGPTEWEPELFTGDWRLDLRDGRILQASSATSDALRLLSFLNFTEILRRLSIAHMFESGIPFEEFTLDARFRDGVMAVELLDLDAASSAFRFSGVTDLGDGELDGELVVTLPVASNLPWVAALAAGPAVAAGVFVVSKVFEKQVNRMSSAVYGVTGSMERPDVKLLRIFEDRTQAPPAQPPAPGAASASPEQETSPREREPDAAGSSARTREPG